jgi:uncharacterized membrane protein
MLGRNKGVTADATEYAKQLIDDDKVRRRTIAALAAALAARRRAMQQTGLTGLARRLATDDVLRQQLNEMVAELRQAQRRADRKRSHKLRNTMLVLAGFGAATAAATVPAVRESVQKLVRRGKSTVGQAAGGMTGGTAPTAVVDTIEVEVPLSTAYNQWTQFEQFPQFMEGVDEVRQLDDALLHWAATVAGKHAEWNARIVEQEPDQRITWESTDGKKTRGTVTFEEIAPGRSRIHLTMSYVAEGPLERAGSAAGLDERRIRGDLERFKEMIESRGVESGAWRGEIHEGSRTS